MAIEINGNQITWTGKCDDKGQMIMRPEEVEVADAFIVQFANKEVLIKIEAMEKVESQV